MKVYIIEYDNCEFHADHQTSIGEVFRTKEMAEEYLTSKGFIKQGDHDDYYDVEYVKETIINGIPVGATGANIIKRNIM